LCGATSTASGDGQAQSSLVWVDVDGVCARINTTLQRQKGRNVLANPKVSLLVVDPDNTARYIQIRGDAELVTARRSQTCAGHRSRPGWPPRRSRTGQ
jgi:PPOX class probable F420-dependent enzyme